MGVLKKTNVILTAAIVIFLTCFSALAEQENVFSDPDAVRICKVQRMEFDKGYCLGAIENKHFDKSVIDICENQEEDFNKTLCLKWISNKRYLSKEDIRYIRNDVSGPSIKLLYLRFWTPTGPLEQTGQN